MKISEQKRILQKLSIVSIYLPERISSVSENKQVKLRVLLCIAPAQKLLEHKGHNFDTSLIEKNLILVGFDS